MCWWQKPLILLVLLILLPGQGALAYSLLPDSADEARPDPRLSADHQWRQAAALLPPGQGAQAGPSLFQGRKGSSFFRPVPPRSRKTPARPVPRGGSMTARLRHLIASVEADPAKGYDSVQFQAVIQPPKPPTLMTLDEILAWIVATPGQQHAIGRYQIVPKTLRGLMQRMNLPGSTRFTPVLQDAMADQLLEDAGYGAFLEGQLDRAGFMNNLARIWAALPNSSGKSHYHGIAGNRAALSWARFEGQMQAIFPR